MSKVAIAQVQSSTDKNLNLRSALALIRAARSSGAELIAFPEFLMAFSPGSQSAEELTQIAETTDGPFVAVLRAAAKAAGIAVLATIYETFAGANRVFDSAVWIDAHGNVPSVYRKLHLYDAFGFKESDKFHPGTDVAPLVQLGEIRFGTMICYDLRFPEMARLLALQGANVLAAPSGWVQSELKSGSLADDDQSQSLGKRLLRRRARPGRQYLYRPQYDRRSARTNAYRSR